MRYVSTQGQAPAVPLSQAVRQGLAPDGGLYLPETLPPLPRPLLERLAAAEPPPPAELAGEMLAPYAAPELDPPTLAQVAAETFSFPIPLVPLSPGVFLLELFHGPTAAFKDVGAGFLARLLPRLPPERDERPLTVLVATSGDTGGAVARAFHGVPGVRVVVLYPEGRVSPLQERQLAGLGGNVRAFAVAGSFDDCQSMAKSAFADRNLARRVRLTSANSINVGRLLPQAVYYLHAAGRLAAIDAPFFIVPSGNLGNLTAGVLAHLSGLPVAGFHAALNANDVFARYLETGRYRPRPSLTTLANAMDVGAPSNLARLMAWLDGAGGMGREITASSHGDDDIRRAIRQVYEKTGTILDPHTAVGWLAWEELSREAPLPGPAVILATAHPAKFAEVLEPVIGRPVPPPAALTELAGRPLDRESIPADYEALAGRL